MFLSIVIPIWNDEKYLEECLDSCLDQNLSKDEYEIICVDDGSTDRTPELLHEYASKYPNIQLMLMERHKGGRTVGLAQARGDYVWFVDHDDFVAQHAVDILFKTVQDHPGFDRYSFPYYQFFYSLTEEERIGKNAGTLRQNDDTFRYFTTWLSIFSVSFLHNHDILPRSNRIGQAELFWDIHPFRIFGGDMIFVEECMDKGATVYNMDCMPLYYYRKHSNTQTYNFSKNAVKERAELRANTVLVWGYLIYQLEQQYAHGKKEYGRERTETVHKIIDKLRESSFYLGFVPYKLWKQDIKLFKSKGLFLKKLPDEYTLSFRDYWKRLSKTERFLPHVYIAYYCYSFSGAVLYRMLSWPYRISNQNNFISRMKRRIKMKRLRQKGIQ